MLSMVWKSETLSLAMPVAQKDPRTLVMAELLPLKWASDTTQEGPLHGDSVGDGLFQAVTGKWLSSSNRNISVCHMLLHAPTSAGHIQSYIYIYIWSVFRR